MPNPFRSATRIAYLPVAAQVELKIYDAAGRLVKELIDGQLPAGTHEAPWSGDDAAGRHVRPGVYFYRLRADAHIFTRRMLLLE